MQECVRIFLMKRAPNASYSLRDFQNFFSDPIGRQIGELYFGQHFWIQRVLNSDRISDISLFYRYFEQFLKGAKNPEHLERLKN